MSENNCWPREKLKEYLAGWADEYQTQQIEAHLSQCEMCEETIVALEKEPDTLVGIVSSLKQESPENESSELAALLAKAGDLVHADGLSDDRADERANDSADDSASRHPALAKIGPYVLQQPLGRGGMGSVFLARHQQLGKLVAIKLLPWRSTHREHFEARFQREVRAAGGLDHPSIVSATDAGQENGTHYLVMEFIDGLDLSRLVRAMGQVRLADACELIRQVALGLSHAHAEGIVHRDVKPSNLMLNRRGQVKILDFGLARLGPWNEESAELTTVGQLMGTLDYMAPEQAERADSVDYRADLYSLGATLFRLLCGRAPLAASPDQSPLAKLRLLATEEPPKLSTLRPDAPQELTQLVAEMLARNPRDRPASAAHVAERLEPFCQSHDLSGLLRTALEKVELLQARTASSSKAVGDVELQQLSSNRLKTVAESNAREARGTSRNWGWIGVACTAIAGLIYCGITIWIDSQSGWLHIDSDAKVSIEIASESAPVKYWKIEPGANSTKLYAGKYRIVLQEGSDGVQLDQQQLLVTKGGVTIAKVYKDGKSTESFSLPPNDAELSQKLSNSSRTAIPPASTAVLVPGDALMISSHADEKLKHKFVIQADSTAKLPMVGTVNVAGLTVDSLQKELNKRYSEWMSVPAIEVFRDPSQATVASSESIPVRLNDKESSSSGAAIKDTSDIAEPTYKGRPLSDWLKMISLERSHDGLTEALQAISASISDRTCSRISSQLKRDLPNVRWEETFSESPNRKNSPLWLYRAAFAVLQKASPDEFDTSTEVDYFDYVLSELQSTSDERWRGIVIKYAIPYGVTSKQLEPLKGWLNAQLAQGPSSKHFDGTVECLLRHVFHPRSHDENREVWLKMLMASPHISDLFWLSLPYSDTPGFAETETSISKSSKVANYYVGGNYPRSEVCWRPLIRLAIKTLGEASGEPSDKTLLSIAYSAAILFESNIQPADDLIPELKEIWKLWSKRLVESESLRSRLVEISYPMANKFEARSFSQSAPSRSYLVSIQYALVSSLAKYSEPSEALIEVLLPGAARSFYARNRDQIDPWNYGTHRFANDLTSLAKGAVMELRDQSTVSGDNPQKVASDRDAEDLRDLCSLRCFNIPKEEMAIRLIEHIKPIYAAKQLKLLDGDNDCKVTIAESADALIRALAVDATALDYDQDQQVSVDEYIAYRNERLSIILGGKGKTTEADVEWAKKQIEKYDKDDNGKLSPEEQSKMLVPPKGADINNDGYVDALEYARYRAR